VTISNEKYALTSDLIYSGSGGDDIASPDDRSTRTVTPRAVPPRRRRGRCPGRAGGCR
jgi:hypothetical protein